MSAVLAETRNALAEAARELARAGAGRRRSGRWRSPQRCSPPRCSRCPAGWPISPASSTSRSPRSASGTRSGSPGSRRSGRAPSSGSAPSPRRSCARRAAGPCCRRSSSPSSSPALAASSPGSRPGGSAGRSSRSAPGSSAGSSCSTLTSFPGISGGAQGLVMPEASVLGRTLTPTAHYVIGVTLVAVRCSPSAVIARAGPGSRSPPAGTRSRPRSASASRSRAFDSARSRPPAVIAGLAGALGVELSQVADPSAYGPVLSFELFVAVILGGARLPLGPVVGLAVIAGFSNAGRGDRLAARAASGAAGGDADRLRDARRARSRRRGAPSTRRCPGGDGCGRPRVRARATAGRAARGRLRARSRRAASRSGSGASRRSTGSSSRSRRDPCTR